MYIGNFNVFEVGCSIDSSDIGNFNEFQLKSTVQEGCTIGDNCQINPCVVIPKRTKLESQTVAYDDGKYRKNTETNEEANKIKIKELC